MLYIFLFITALLLASGQSLWKKAAINFPIYLKNNTPLIPAIFKVIFSKFFIIGAFLYIIATLIYLWLFSKYPFYTVQISLVAFVIILSLIISNIIFKESINTINYIGVSLVLIGIILVTWGK